MGEIPERSPLAAPRRWRLGPVLLVLLAVGLALTVYQYIFQRHIAPEQPLVWQTFAPHYWDATTGRGMSLVLVAGSGDQRPQVEQIQQRLDQPQVRQRIHPMGAPTFVWIVDQPQDRQWLARRLPDAQLPLVAVASPRWDRPRVVAVDETLEQQVVQLLDEIRRR